MPHRAMSWGWSSAAGTTLQGAWLGVLTYVIPPGLAEEAIGDGLAWEMRLRKLPARVALYFTLGLCLFTGTSYAGVFGQVTAGLGLLSPASTALTAARRRLGEKPLESLFRRLCGSLSPGREPWSHVGGLLAAAWDGTGIELADTPQNAAAFGRPSPAAREGGAAAAPQARLVALITCGTRSLLDAAFGPCRGEGTSERRLAARMLGSLRPGMLLLADRGFYSWGLWNAAAATGAHLLWRAPAVLTLLPARELPDGSFLARIEDPAAVRRRTARNGNRRRRGSALPPDTAPVASITVRVISYLLTVTADDGSTRTEPYRLITTLPDHRAHPAAMLAAAYARRWSIETGYRECKTYLRGAGRALRGRTPDLARQEIWALLAVYQAIRALIARAAARGRLDPGRISFTAALEAARSTMRAPRGQLTAVLDGTDRQILAENALVRPREGRVWPRTVKRKPATPYQTRRNRPGPVSRNAAYTATIIPLLQPAATTTDQRRQPAASTTTPPLNS